MKLNKKSQLGLAAAASLLAAGLLTACATLTVDFVYFTSAKAAGSNNYGVVNVFEINSESGFMRQIPSSPFPSMGRNPVASAVTADYNTLYVANKDDDSIVQFQIGPDGKLYAQNTVNVPGIFPVALAVNGNYLFELNTYQQLPTCSNLAPCSGSIAVYPISTDTAVNPVTGGYKRGTLGSPIANGSLNYWPLTLSGAGSADVLLPTAVSAFTASSKNFVYVGAFDTTAGTGYLFGYTAASGVLTPINSGIPFTAGTRPSAIKPSPDGKYLFVTDLTAGTVISYTIASDGSLSQASTVASGNQPSALVVDSAGKFLYVANKVDSNVTAFTVSGSTLTRIGAWSTGQQPVAIGIDPRMNHFVFTANYLGSSVSGFTIWTDGTLVGSRNTPYAANQELTSAVAIPHNGSVPN